MSGKVTLAEPCGCCRRRRTRKIAHRKVRLKAIRRRCERRALKESR
jgi:hypothetical protein